MMPLMSGEQLIDALRSQLEAGNMPIMVLSAKADESLRLRLLADGA